MTLFLLGALTMYLATAAFLGWSAWMQYGCPGGTREWLTLARCSLLWPRMFGGG